jgi:hypothetical protein
MYTHAWDPAQAESHRTGADLIRSQAGVYEEAGIQHVVAALSRRDLDGWLRSMEALAGIVGLEPR